MSAAGYNPPAYNSPPPPVPHPWGPFTAGELLRRTFGLYREHFAVFLGISAVAAALGLLIQLPMQLLPAAIGLSNITPATISPDIFLKAFLMVPIGIVAVLVGMYIFVLTYGAMFFAVSDIRQGRPVSVTSALQETAPRSFRLLGAYLWTFLRVLGWLFLFGIAVSIVAVVIIFIGIAAGMQFPSAQSLQSQGAGGQPNFAAFGIVMIAFVLFLLVALVVYVLFLLWLYARYLLFIPVLLAENATPNAAVSRSVQLTRRSKGRIYALLLICFVLGLVAFVAASPFFFLSIRSAMMHTTASPVIAMGQMVVIALVQMLLTHPVLGIGISLCYFDLRARKEAVAAPPAVVSLPPSQQPFNSAPAGFAQREISVEPAPFPSEPEDAPRDLKPEPPISPEPSHDILPRWPDEPEHRE